VRTLNLYIASIFLRFFLIILAALVSLYALVDFLEKVDDFIEHGATFAHYLFYPLYNLPLILSNTLPMAILLGAFATIGALSRTSQLTALFGSGVSFNQISRPLFLCGMVLCLLVFLGNAWVLPLANREAHYLIKTEIKGSETVKIKSENLYLRDDNMILGIAYSFPHKSEIAGVSLLTFDENFQLSKRLEADRGYYQKDGHWKLKNVKTWDFSPDTREISSYAKYDKQLVNLHREPDSLLHLWQNPEDMTLPELAHNIGKFRSEGQDSRQHQIELQVRLAKSATPLVMVLLGIPFAMQRGRQANFSVGFITSLIIFIVYFLLQATFTAFASAAILSPLVAAWAANVLLALAGIWLFLRVQS
jgi:lipopolysaccharide export system permease protein